MIEHTVKLDPIPFTEQAIRLYTVGGGYVATVDVPGFHPPVDVIVWGSRHFVITELDNKDRETEPSGFAYIEGVIYHHTGEVRKETGIRPIS